MRWKIAWLLALGVAHGCVQPPADAADPDAQEAEVLAAVHRFLDAMDRGDVEAYARVVHPEGMTFSQRIGPEGPGPLRIRSNAEHIQALAESDEHWHERIWDPVVMVHEPIAMVWTPYDFHIDGEFSHCGVDIFELFLIDGEWRMTNASWTAETVGCEPSPLGPPDIAPRSGGPPSARAPAAETPADGPHAVRSGHFTTSDGVRLHYLESGSGPALVFVPGWTMPAEIFEAELRRFAGDHRVVALDPRSQGRSEKVSEGHYPERRARDVLELVEALHLAPAVLVGWSLGVPELLTYVREFGTETVRALALVDGYIGADPVPGAPDPMAGVFRRLHADREAYTRDFVRSMYRTPQTEDYLERITLASLGTPTNTAFALLAHVMVTRGDWRDGLDRVDRPLLYVVTPQLRDQAEMVRARRPETRVELLEEAGHALFVDAPDRFHELLEELIASAPR